MRWELDTRGSGDEHASGGIKSAVTSSNRYARSSAIAAWPPHPGDYVLGNLQGSVAICTLSNRDLPVRLIAAREPAVAIAGRCDTENIGVEKIVLNLLANPRIRWLVICGAEAKGHRAGQALLRLKERGVDADMRVLESASWRPILKNLTLLDVAQFRQQIEEVNLNHSSRRGHQGAGSAAAAEGQGAILEPETFLCFLIRRFPHSQRSSRIGTKLLPSFVSE